MDYPKPENPPAYPIIEEHVYRHPEKNISWTALIIHQEPLSMTEYYVATTYVAMPGEEPHVSEERYKSTYDEAAHFLSYFIQQRIEEGYQLVHRYYDDEFMQKKGLLTTEALETLLEVYPVGCRVYSPSGRVGEVLNINRKGDMRIKHLDTGEEIILPFGSYHYLTRISHNLSRN